MTEPDDAQKPRRGGHGPELERLLALKILSVHLRERDQQLNTRLDELRGLPTATAMLLIRAMAAAAHSDGELDQRERRLIQRALASLEGDLDHRLEIETELEQPPCLEGLVRQVDTPHTAAQFYAVSLRVVDRYNKVHLAYLRYLGQRLALPGDLVVRLNRRFRVRT